MLYPVLSLLGCPSSILPLYKEHEAEALAKPGPVPDRWEPDALFTAHDEMVKRLVKTALQENGTLEETLEVAGAKLTPTLTVKRLELSGQNCDDCLNVSSSLKGKLDWSVLGASGKDVPFSADADFTVQLEVRRKGSEWVALAKPTDLRKVKVDVAGLSTRIRGLAEGPLKTWVDEKLIPKVEPIEVGRFGSKEVPILAARFVEADSGLRLAILTGSPSPTPIPIGPAKLREGWRFDISADSLMDLARAAAFAAGPQDHDVVVEPNAIRFRAGTFALDLRIWRLSGKGWWRDYETSGTYELKKKKLALVAEDVKEVGQSQGAVFVDPLAALGEGILLGIISDSLTTTIPTLQKSPIGEKQAQTHLTGLHQSGEVVTMMGGLKLTKGSGRR